MSGTRLCIRCGRSFDATVAGDELCAKCASIEQAVQEAAPDTAATVPLAHSTVPLSAADTPDRETAGQAVAGRRFDADEDVPAEWHAGYLVSGLYEVRGLLGKGGFGNVYRVHHSGWNLDLAVKSPLPGVLEASGGVDQFVSEAEDWVDLGLHPHIVTCHYVRTLGGIPRVFAECMEGGSLADWIRDGRLYEGESGQVLKRMLDVAIQFAWGLGYAHEKGLIHQDVKPENVMMTPDGTAKVTDFGLARGRVVEDMAVPDGAGKTIVVRGTGMSPVYCSPEQAGGETLTRRTDLWSWGLSVLEMFSGRAFWSRPEEPRLAVGQLAPQALAHYLEHGPEDERIPAMPDGLAALLHHCFNMDPAARPGDFETIAEGLGAVFNEATGAAYHREQPEAAELLAGALNNQALSLFDLGRPDEALEAFNSALEADPLHLEATYNLGYLAWRRAELTDQDYLDRLRRIEPGHATNPAYWHNMGLVHAERLDADAAREAFEKATTEDHDGRRYPVREMSLPSFRKVGELATRFSPSKSTYSKVEAAAISPDGQYALTSDNSEGLRVWRLSDGELHRNLVGHEEGPSRLHLKAKVLSAVFSPDGRFVVSGGKDGTVRIWGLPTSGGPFETADCVRVLEGHDDQVLSVAVSSDGRYCLSGSADKTARLWDTDTGACLDTLHEFSGPVECVCFTENSRTYLTASESLKQWEVETGKCLKRFEGSAGAIHSISLSSDGRRCLGRGGRLLIWDMDTGDLLKALDIPADCAAFALDGLHCVSTHKGELHVWDLTTGARISSSRIGTRGSLLAVSHNGQDWLVGNELRQLEAPRRFFEFLLATPAQSAKVGREDEQVRQLIAAATRGLERGHWNEAHRRIREAQSIPGHEHAADVLELMAQCGAHGTRSGLRDAWLSRSLDMPGNRARRGHRIALSPDGEAVVVGGDKVVLVDSATGAVRWSKSACTGRLQLKLSGSMAAFGGMGPAIPNYATSLGWSRDANIIASGGTDHIVRIWDCAGNAVNKLEGHPDWVLAVALSPDGRYCMSGDRSGGFNFSDDQSGNGTIRVWDVETGRCLWSHDHCEHKWRKEWLIEKPHLAKSVQAVAFSPDGSTCVSGGEDKVARLWDTSSGQCLAVSEGHSGEILTVCFSPDGGTLLTAGKDKTVRLWDVERGRCSQVLEGHDDSVNSICLTPDGRYALSGSSDGTLRLWDLAAATCVRTLETHAGPVSSLTLSRDGARALSSAGESAQLWELDWEWEFPSTS